MSSACCDPAKAPSEPAAVDYTYRGPVFRTHQFEILGYVGKGGFGEVHFAKLTDDDGGVRDVAVKQFIPDVGGPARAFRSKFMKESAIHMRLADGCACVTQLVGITDGDCWQVLERLGLYEVIACKCALRSRLQPVPPSQPPKQ
jgi:hypothetical protein